MARSASLRSAEGVTIIALLPPSSRIVRPSREATTGASALPMRVEPVADTSGTRASAASCSPMLRPPWTTCDRPAGASPNRSRARSNSFCVAKAVRGVFSDGFQTTLSPQTIARAAFHAQTATGKLKALITPTGPSGCQVSIIRCPGRSEAIVSPYNWRESPTAKSQMSIISWTSPRPSCTILPASSVTSLPKACLLARSSSPNRRISSPRLGAGTSRQARKASTEALIFPSTSADVSLRTDPRTAPSIGLRTVRSPRETSSEVIPSAFSVSDTKFASVCIQLVCLAGIVQPPPDPICPSMQLHGSPTGLPSA